MSNVVNVAMVETWTFLDTANALVTGKVNGDFTKTAYLASNPATTASVTVAAVSGQSGDYSATFTPTAVGRWKLNVSCLHSGTTYRWEEVFDVVTAAEANPLEQTPATYTAGSVGALAANLDAAMSTRAAASSWTPTRATKIDNLDAAVTTRASQTSVDAIDLTGISSTLTTVASTVASRLDVAVSTRSSQTSIDSLDLTAINTAVGDLQTSVDALTVLIESDPDIDNLITSVATLQSAINTAQASIDALATDLADLAAFEATLTNVETIVTANLDAAVSSRVPSATLTTERIESLDLLDDIAALSLDGLPTSAEIAGIVAAAVADLPDEDYIDAAVAPLTTSAIWTSARAAKLDRIGSGSATVSSPVATTGTVTIYQGDDYATADGRELSWSIDGAPDLTGATVTLTIDSRNIDAITITCSVTNAGDPTQLVVAELSDTDTAALLTEITKYDLSAELANGSMVTLARGTIVVMKDMG